MKMKRHGAHKLWMMLMFLAVYAAVTAIVMLLWNALIPAIFNGVAAIGFWQSAGLILLSRLLLGGFGKWGHGIREKHRKYHHAAAMHEKFHSMPKNERREFIRQHMEQAHGMYGFAGRCRDGKAPNHVADGTDLGDEGGVRCGKEGAETDNG